MVCTWMGDRSGMSISADSPADETLNRGPLALLLRWQCEFPFWINIVQFSIFQFFFFFRLWGNYLNLRKNGDQRMVQIATCWKIMIWTPKWAWIILDILAMDTKTCHVDIKYCQTLFKPMKLGKITYKSRFLHRFYHLCICLAICALD